ncbi:MAG: DNA-binding protein, partial [Bacteroidetes bacterium QH_2_63_10]
MLSITPTSDTDDEGVERLEVVLESSDGALARPMRYTLWILDDPTAQTTLVEGDSGEVLIDSLQQTFGDPRPLGDDFARDSMYAVVYNEADTVEGQYSGFRIEVDPSEGDPSTIAANKGINNEHTWPQSKGAGEEPATSDLHILVPARAEVNSARSNFPYGEIPDADADTWYFEDQEQ